MNNEYLDENGFWSYEKERDYEWSRLPQEEKDLILKYLKLLSRFAKDPSKVGLANKKWILENCDCKTDLVPVKIHNSFYLGG